MVLVPKQSGEQTSVPTLHYRCIGESISYTDSNQTLLDVSIANKVPHWRVCGGRGRCTTCRVRILDGVSHLSPRTALEKTLAQVRNWDSTVRLACQTRAAGEVVLERVILSGADASQLSLETVGAEAGEDRSLAILFCDMRNFVGLTESNSAFDVVHILNRFFTAVGEPILLNAGVITQYVGDQICGIFGMNEWTAEQSCRAAVRAALGMVEALDELNRSISEEFDLQIAIGVGVHYGTAIVGRVGHPAFKHLAVNGDDVNMASRIEAMNKSFNTTVLVSDTVVNHLPAHTLNITRSERIRLRGRDQSTGLNAVSGFSEPNRVLLVQGSAAKLLDDSAGFAKRFYPNLFAVAPELEALFVNGTVTQGPMLEHMLRNVVFGLGGSRYLSDGLRRLGSDHVKYGVEPKHYACFKEAFINTIAETFNSTPQGGRITDAWAETIDVVLQLMQGGVEGARFGLD